MDEEDQESHFDDPDEQEEPIKVSVTFKPPEPEHDDVKLIDNSKNEALDDKSGESRQVNDTCCEFDTEESRLPNPPVTPISSCLDPKKASEGHEAEQSEVLEGWKGYSNNIYIQPIIVNHASFDTCPCPTNQKTQRRLTSEDLRKQMRLREANVWITKHNERIRSTGTLRTRVQFNEEQNQQVVKDLPKQTNDKDKTKTKQRKIKSKLHKGFVCRTWATNFLPKDAIENEEEEFSPFFVRRYVDNSKLSSSAVEKKVTTKMSEEKRNISQLPSTQKDSEELIKPSTTESVCSLEIKLLKLEKVWVDENNNEKLERCIKTTKTNFQSFQNISHGICCCCGEGLAHDKEIKRSQSTLPFTKHSRQERSRSSKETACVILPIKQFPPINPLDGLKKTNIPASTRRGVLPPRRPHTVDTAILSKEAILVNGHPNLPNYAVKTSGSLSGLYRERDSTFSPGNLNKEKYICPRVKFEKNWDGSKHFDEGMNLLSSRMEADRRGSETLDRNATPQSTLHEERNNQGRRGRWRSISDPRGNAKPSRIIFDENENVLHGNTRNRLPLRTPPHSLNGEDKASNTDSNDTGLGSEIEYTIDGSAKLDIYLQSRGASCH